MCCRHRRIRRHSLLVEEADRRVGALNKDIIMVEIVIFTWLRHLNIDGECFGPIRKACRRCRNGRGQAALGSDDLRRLFYVLLVFRSVSLRP